MIAPIVFNKEYLENCQEIIYEIKRDSDNPSDACIDRIERLIKFTDFISNNDFHISSDQAYELSLTSIITYAFGLRIPMHKSRVLAIDLDEIDEETVMKLVEEIKSESLVDQIDIMISSRSMSGRTLGWHVYCGLVAPTDTLALIKKYKNYGICSGYLTCCSRTMQQVIRVSRKFNVPGVKTKIMRHSTLVFRDGKWINTLLGRSIVPLIIQDGQSVNTTQKPKRYTLNLRTL